MIKRKNRSELSWNKMGKKKDKKNKNKRNDNDLWITIRMMKKAVVIYNHYE